MARPGARDGTLRLPAERSSFVGRRAELAEVRRLLSAARLGTLVGPGGVGKTRLALRAAADVRRSFPDGVTLADLTPVSDPSSVVERVAAALDVRDVSGSWLPARVAEVVGNRQVLLVLDNCEQVRDAAAVLVDTLLAACPRLSVLATSRVPLDVDGEALLAVPPLPVPPAGGPSGPDDAVQLLVQRAEAAVPGLALTPADAEVLADVCRRLDGLPLAVELAAVRLRTLTPAELAARLDDRFALLARSGTAGAERHRTLRATVQWSADLLAPAERVLWRRASVFAAGFDLAAAEAVCADGVLPAPAVLAALDRLAEASLLVGTRVGDGRRFRMLETVRAYGRELLAGSGEEAALRRRHRDWCAGVVSAAAAEFTGPAQVAALDAVDAVHAEVGEALQWGLGVPGEAEHGLALAADLWLYWAARGHLGEGRRHLAALLAACPRPTSVRARGLLAAGYVELTATDADAAVPLLEQARDLGAVTGPAQVPALATQFLGQAALFRGDLAAADRLLREAAAALASTDPRHEAFCWADVGVTAFLAGDLPAAAAAFERGLALGADPWTRSHALWGLGLVRLAAGAPAEAAGSEHAALQLMREVDDRSGTALCVEALAEVAAAERDWERAARLAGAADGVWRSIPAVLPAPLRGRREECARAAVQALGERRWAALHREGAALSRAAAVALALGDRSPVPAPRTEADPLTPRQREVAELVAQGLTDREIASRLVISPRTAESHVEQILARLGFRSRAEIAAWTAARGSTSQ
ncbi:putative ATPase [Geodermatophilus tzadiensis]|uniref:Putative ATPase n=1 Tax=Geodermatophilus tzadiensis TaxID=1137988 RepID=A0A2T0TC71_9ACTN|nr:LuxR C-terminal-related transcriptional regulator [Geodermatophilus tzadiensis]PRY43260.1 putative ATPase [Geodermatophilus tzadiensis]